MVSQEDDVRRAGLSFLFKLTQNGREIVLLEYWKYTSLTIMLADIQNQLWNLIIPPRSDLDCGHFGEADVDTLLLFCKIPPSPRFFSHLQSAQHEY